MKRLSILVAALVLPFAAFAQVTTVDNLFTLALNYINGVFVPLIFAVAFLYFLYGIYRYFISSGGNEEKVKEGQKFVMWAVVGFVLMFSIWGIINVFVNTLGFEGSSMPAIPTFNSSGSTGSTGGSSIFGNLFGNTGGSTTNGTYSSDGISYPVIGTDPTTGGTIVQPVNGSCPPNFLENSSGSCQGVGASGSGSVAQGGKCTKDGDCTGDLACESGTCSTDSSLDAAGYGQGNGTVQQGGTCKSGDDCAGYLTCSSNDVCVTDSSLDGSGYGQGTGEVLQGGACETNNDCAGNLACSNGSCQPDSNLDVGDGSLGSACQSSDQCNGSYECLSGVCSQPSDLGQQGDTCSTNNDCYGNLYCSPNGTCQPDSDLESQDTYTDTGSDSGGSVDSSGNTGS